MGHVGLTPQSINTIGSFRAQGRDEADWGPIEADAKAVADAGAFSVVIEAVAEPLGRRITEQVAIPTIGIGASPACDGQILVLEDMLGLSPRVPKFVRRYGELGVRVSRRRSRPMPATCGRGPSRPRTRLPDAKKGPLEPDFIRVLGRFRGWILPCPRHIDRVSRGRSGPWSVGRLGEGET